MPATRYYSHLNNALNKPGRAVSVYFRNALLAGQVPTMEIITTCSPFVAREVEAFYIQGHKSLANHQTKRSRLIVTLKEGQPTERAKIEAITYMRTLPRL